MAFSFLTQGMANKDAVLERRPEHTQSRLHTYDNATAVYDLLAIALVRRSNCSILTEVRNNFLRRRVLHCLQQNLGLWAMFLILYFYYLFVRSQHSSLMDSFFKLLVKGY